MEGDFIKKNHWLRPLSCIYRLVVNTRNMMFEMGILKSRAFDVPVIAVGNITVGGTGKTPHIEYLVRALKGKYNVAVLSRGYKRKSKGFIVADENSTALEIGDEPFQIKKKFPNITVAVDKDRCHGIDMLEERDEKMDVVLLDDAYQHRYVKPGINILLVDYHRLIIYDDLLPVGRLREPVNGKNRADIVIVTKCPKDLKPMDFRVLYKAMDLYPYQQLFFTTLHYDSMVPLFGNGQEENLDVLKDKNVLVVSGIASPEQIIHDLSPHCKHIEQLSYSDHHHFKKKDLIQISETFAAMEGPKCIVTTEKDASRLVNKEGMSDEMKANIYALPIKIQFMHNKEEEFNEYIINYVNKNSRNSILTKKSDKMSGYSKSGQKNSRTISFKNDGNTEIG